MSLLKWNQTINISRKQRRKWRIINKSLTIFTLKYRLAKNQAEESVTLIISLITQQLKLLSMTAVCFITSPENCIARCLHLGTNGSINLAIQFNHGLN